MAADNRTKGSLPAQAFDTPELKRRLRKAIAESGTKVPLPADAFDTPERKRALRQAILQSHTYARYPRFWEALKEDVRVYSKWRGEPRKLESWREVLQGAFELARDTDAFLGLALYRARARLLARGVPVIPQVLHRVCIAGFQINIGSSVVVQPGIYIPHGQIVLDGNVEVGTHVTLGPWVTVGLTAGQVEGPKIGNGASIGTGAKLVGPIKIGAGARIGANAVVIADVPAQTTAVGVPARAISKKPDAAVRAAVRAKRTAEAAQAREGSADPSKK